MDVVWECLDLIKLSGERGIRTLGTVTSTTVFETVPFDHSGISPDKILSKVEYKNKKFHGFNSQSATLSRALTVDKMI